MDTEQGERSPTGGTNCGRGRSPKRLYAEVASGLVDGWGTRETMGT